MRKLASIQKILSLTPIPNTDNIEVAQVLGWKTVVKKGEFKVGNLVIYIEIDSILPSWSEFEFLKNYGFRIKTIKLRKQISQGICFSIKDLRKYLPATLKEGMDITKFLEIYHYADKIDSSHCIPKPAFIPTTDEIRIQTIPEVIERNKEKDVYITEKLDGMSCSFVYYEDKFLISSRNVLISQDHYDNNIIKCCRHFNLQNKITTLNKNWVFQGELVGPGIQKNKYNLSQLDIYFFDIYDIDQGQYLSYDLLQTIIKAMELKMVPLIKIDKLGYSLNALIDFSFRQSILNTQKPAEGIVIRTIDNSSDIEIGRLSFKVINPNFLLKYE